MKHEIKQQNEKLTIKISGIKDKQNELISSFESCQQGKCDCPTDEYKRLDSMNINSNENDIVLNLKSKQGQFFSKSEIEKCIEFTVNKISVK